MKEKKSGQIFAAAQQVGKSLFLPIAVLPFAGILLGIGSSFTNPTTIATYGLSGILHQGTVLYGFMLMLSNAGNAIFSNLALIFALAVALGMAKKEKGVAVMSSAIFYIVMLMTINTLLVLDGSIVDGVVAEHVKEGAITSMLGIQTLQMGVFGGIIAGLITAALCNRFYKIQLPTALSFFAGTRFVPIASMAFAILTGAILYVVWPIIQNAIFALGTVVQASGYFGTFVYGCIERALIPFGLHHIFYLPFWQTGVGGTALIDGVTVMGAQNIFFAELASPNTTKFSIDACRFLTGKYPFMMGGLPGAALAMYVTAKPEKKKEVGSLLFSVALTSFLTGITEPIEFTFLFLAPALFGVHVVLAGLSFMTCHILNICIGTTFSDGLIDLILYGILPGQAKSNWMVLIPVLVVYFVVYFFLFRFFILKMDLKTPGREAEGETARLISKDEYRKATGVGVAGGKAAAADFDQKSAMILKGVGGVDNLIDIDCCATRLRLTLMDSKKVDESLLKATGASGVVVKGAGIQVIYGPSVTIVKSNFEEFVEQVRSGAIPESSFMDLPEQTEEKPEKEKAEEKAAAEAEKKETEEIILFSHMNGEVVPLCDVKDEAFASGALGEGVAVEPSEGKLFAPVDGTVATVFPTKHAVGMVTASGTELILHIGIDTVRLEGKHFETHVEAGTSVKKGDLLVSFDMEAIKQEGYPCTTPMIVCNSAVKVLASGTVKAGDALISLQS
ncbi:MAG: glucose PTS transporter subunit IIA [Candidatus Choladocola sp.]|nr:glucose PTS transporter subunit IIA [Candidatus Choladocola sp.]